MTLARLKQFVFLLEALNGFATAYYFNYLFFYLRSEFGFTSAQNLLFSAFNGCLYMVAAWYGGRFGQKRGYFVALKLGFFVMTLAMLAGNFSNTVLSQTLVMVAWTLGMCFTWANLEALVGEKETNLPRMVGIYNVVWAGGAALAYFSGGAIVEWLGWQSIFWLPALFHFAQLLITMWLQKQEVAWVETERPAHQVAVHKPAYAPLFLKMAWVANPFAYIAINTAIPLMPDLAARLSLTPMFAGFFCSIWLFARLATFFVLWFWPGWHYKMRWMVGCFVGLIICFAGLLLMRNFFLLIMAQVIFGFCVGLIYYSSLYYSMDVGETKGEHGGIHEAAIGVGIFVGPALGYGATLVYPGKPQSSVWAVSGLLTLGLVALLQIHRGRRKSTTR